MSMIDIASLLPVKDSHDIVGWNATRASATRQATSTERPAPRSWARPARRMSRRLVTTVVTHTHTAETSVASHRDPTKVAPSEHAMPIRAATTTWNSGGL